MHLWAPLRSIKRLITAAVRVQHVLTVFRTQKIVRLLLHLSAKDSTLTMVVHADNGNSPSAFQPCALDSPYKTLCVLIYSHQLPSLPHMLANLMLCSSCACFTGLAKRYTLNCLESEIMQATVDKESLPTFLLAEASELSR